MLKFYYSNFEINLFLLVFAKMKPGLLLFFVEIMSEKNILDHNCSILKIFIFFDFSLMTNFC